MAGWSTKEHKLSSGKKGLKSWAKAEGGRVQTSSGWTVDFLTKNFDVKHLHIVSDSTPINTLLALGRQRRDERKNHLLMGHGGSAVSASNVNSIIAMTEGTLAAWGGKIAKRVANSGHSHIFHGQPQWDVTTDLEGAAFLTHNQHGPLTVGTRVTVTATCEKGGPSLIYVCHFVAAGTSTRGAISTAGNQIDLTDEISKKREARFKWATKADEVIDVSWLFG